MSFFHSGCKWERTGRRGRGTRLQGTASSEMEDHSFQVLYIIIVYKNWRDPTKSKPCWPSLNFSTHEWFYSCILSHYVCICNPAWTITLNYWLHDIVSLIRYACVRAWIIISLLPHPDRVNGYIIHCRWTATSQAEQDRYKDSLKVLRDMFQRWHHSYIIK